VSDVLKTVGVEEATTVHACIEGCHTPTCSMRVPCYSEAHLSAGTVLTGLSTQNRCQGLEFQDEHCCRRNTAPCAGYCSHVQAGRAQSSADALDQSLEIWARAETNVIHPCGIGPMATGIHASTGHLVDRDSCAVWSGTGAA
jgi:hypothetical protein